jgi:hypothetical protein
MQIIRERLGGGVADGHGVAWVGMSGYVGAVAGGGLAETTAGACSTCSYTDEDSSSRHDDEVLLHVVGTIMEIDPNTGTSNFSMGFAAPPGAHICAHLWVLIP